MNIYKMGILVGLFSILGTQVAVAGDFVTGMVKEQIVGWLIEKSTGAGVWALRLGLTGLAASEGAALAGTNQGSSSKIQQLLSYTRSGLGFLQWLSTTDATFPIVESMNQSPVFQGLLKYGPKVLSGAKGVLG